MPNMESWELVQPWCVVIENCFLVRNFGNLFLERKFELPLLVKEN
jgi:hypothetical protein